MSIGISRNMSLGLGRGGSSLLSQVSTILAASKGAYWDWTGPTVFEDTAGTDPAEIGDAVALLSPKIVGTVASVSWDQSTVGLRPTYQAGYGSFSGSNGLNGNAANLGIFRNVGTGTFAAKFRVTSFAANSNLFGWSTPTSSVARFQAGITTAGELSVTVRRLDADVATTVASTGLGLQVNTDYTIIITVDWATGGTGAIRAYINNGADVLNGTLAGSGATQDTASAFGRLGVSISGATFLTGRLYPCLAANILPTAAQRSTIHALLSA